MLVAVLVKQVPRVEDMTLGHNGRIRREGVELEMNAYCRRAVSKGVEIAKESGGRCIVFTLGPPSAEDVLREAVAWGADEGVLVSDPAFAGSDTLATARAVTGALEMLGPFDLILAGRNSIDADTGQVGPEVAELLGYPLAAGVREIEISDGRVTARCELDDGWRTVRLPLPALLTVAERSAQPCKVKPEGRAQVDPARIRRIGPAQLGDGPWGAAGSPTTVGSVRSMEVSRRQEVLSGSVEEQVERALAFLGDRGAVGSVGESKPGVPLSSAETGAAICAVVLEPDRPRVARELLGEAAELAHSLGGRVVALGSDVAAAQELAAWGADAVVHLSGAMVEEDVATAVAHWCDQSSPWAVLVPGTLWGREVAARIAARLGAGLTGDAVGFSIESGRLICWKPALGGRLVAAITATSAVQLATVRPGVLPLRTPREAGAIAAEWIDVVPLGRVEVIDSGRDDDVDALLAAHNVVAVGAGVDPAEYGLLQPLLAALGAELGASRKVTDKGWLPRARQIGLTGHSVAPAIFIALGISGSFNQMVGSRGAGTVIAVNQDPAAPVFRWADIGIVADWRQAVSLLASGLEEGRGLAAAVLQAELP